MTRILVLCTGNRCRSQMAQGILQSLDPLLEVHSAGTRPASEVHPLGIKVMAEIGIDISRNYPKHISRYLNQSWDYVITVCSAANESCPVFIGQVLPEFRRVRDDIKKKMRDWYLSEILNKHDL